ncbi:hypothetical protein ACJX0J_011765, partial [Zea mays]
MNLPLEAFWDQGCIKLLLTQMGLFQIMVHNKGDAHGAIFFLEISCFHKPEVL